MKTVIAICLVIIIGIAVLIAIAEEIYRLTKEQ
jgi:hypothetical protein